MRFGQLIIKNLTRRPARTALTLIALATAITAVVSLFAIANGFTRSFADVYSSHGVDIVVSRQGSADRLSSSIDQNFAEKIAGLPGVARTAPVMLETLSLEQEAIYGIPTMGVLPDSWLLENYQFKEREAPLVPTEAVSQDGTQNSEPMTIMLGIHLAERLQKKVGQTLDLFEQPYRITGIFQSTSTWENGSMILPLGQLQSLTDRSGQATYINVILEEPKSAGTAQTALQAIQDLDKRLLPLTTSDYVQTDTRMNIAHAMAWMTSVIALAIGTIGTLNTMLTSVMERTKEIGILRAIGWPRRRVVAMILCESCGLSLIASFLGILLAFALTWTLSSAPQARGLITPDISQQVILQGLSLAVLIGILGALLPAWRAAKLLPTEAFREN